MYIDLRHVVWYVLKTNEVGHFLKQFKINKSYFFLISDFRRKVDENYVLLVYYAASSGNSLPTSRDNLSVLYFKGQESKRILITKKDVFLLTTFCFSLGRMDSHNILDQCFNCLIACIPIKGRKCTRRPSSLHYLEMRDPYGRLHSAPSVCVTFVSTSVPNITRFGKYADSYPGDKPWGRIGSCKI